jgi:hypothetical protein
LQEHIVLLSDPLTRQGCDSIEVRVCLHSLSGRERDVTTPPFVTPCCEILKTGT